MERELLRTVQLAQLEVAKEFKRICEENGLRYIIDCGSLLGAVRHKGFIPWDDDMDFAMPRADYDRFFEIMKAQNGRGFSAVRWDSTKGYPHPFGKFTKDGTVYREAKADKSYGIYVDIFPYDNMPPREKVKSNRFKMMACRAMMRAKCGYRTYVDNGKIIPKKLLKNLPFICLSVFFSAKGLAKRYDTLATAYNGEKSQRICAQCEDVIYSWQADADTFEAFTRVPFEDTDFSAPENYDKYLRGFYGDYMQLPPEDQRENRHSVVEIKL